MVNLITGVLKPHSGRVLLRGDDITASMRERARRGLARTFQINQLFRGLTVLEICMTVGDATAQQPAARGGSKRDVIDEAIGYLDSLRLTDDALKLVRELPYGRERLVEIAIALAQKPRVLLLDEPAAGVPSSESHLILDVVAALIPTSPSSSSSTIWTLCSALPKRLRCWCRVRSLPRAHRPKS